jgi:hypothetical protein
LDYAGFHRNLPYIGYLNQEPGDSAQNIRHAD